MTNEEFVRTNLCREFVTSGDPLIPGGTSVRVVGLGDTSEKIYVTLPNGMFVPGRYSGSFDRKIFRQGLSDLSTDPNTEVVSVEQAHLVPRHTQLSSTPSHVETAELFARAHAGQRVCVVKECFEVRVGTEGFVVGWVANSSENKIVMAIPEKLHGRSASGWTLTGRGFEKVSVPASVSGLPFGLFVDFTCVRLVRDSANAPRAKSDPFPHRCGCGAKAFVLFQTTECTSAACRFHVPGARGAA